MDLNPFANRRPFEFKKFAIRVQNSRIYLKMPSSSQFLNALFAFFANFKRFKQFLKGFQAVLNMVLNSIFAIFSAFPVLFESISLDSTQRHCNRQKEQEQWNDSHQGKRQFRTYRRDLRHHNIHVLFPPRVLHQPEFCFNNYGI